MTRCKPVAQKSGFTLVEMIAAFSVLFVLAITSVQLLSAVTRVGVATADRRMTRNSVQRFADQIHDDRRDATKVSVNSDDEWQLTFLTPVGEVSYQFLSDDASLRRTVTRDDAVVATDRYVLAKDASPTIELTDNAIRLWLRRSTAVTWMVEITK